MSLAGVRAPFVIVGGIATALYMPQRTTLDLDILVAPEDAPGMYQELRELGFSLQHQLSIGGTGWVSPEGDELDVLVLDEPWVRRAIATPNMAPSGEPVVALPYLVLMKLSASRPQDLADLSRMLGGADETVLGQVREAIRSYRPDELEDVESLIALGRLEYAADEEERR